MKIAVAMSSGLDSSVAAAILKSEGHQVIGITMRILPSDSLAAETGIKNAQEVARILGIPHHVIDLKPVFQELVIDEFCREYARGRTPNPCTRCNRFLKFGALWDKARELGADYMATGHYARVEMDETGGRYLLKKGIDPAKDQSYVLYALTREQLPHIHLPLGGYTKRWVRELAREFGLPVLDRTESQEICFIPGGDYARFLKKRIPTAARPGPVVDGRGNVLGQHRGIPSYTVGQRKRLGVAAGKPLYVTSIDAISNTVFVGQRNELHRQEFLISGLNWLVTSGLDQPQEVMVKIRYHHREAAATIAPEGEDLIRVRFHEPQPAVTPGQAAVFYDGETVVGGGVIERAVR